MLASLEEAEALLRQWNLNGSQILCTSFSRGRTFNLSGFVVEANRQGFIIANSRSSERWYIWFFQVRNFEIENLGEGPVTVRLSFHDGDEMTLDEETLEKKYSLA